MLCGNAAEQTVLKTFRLPKSFAFITFAEGDQTEKTNNKLKHRHCEKDDKNLVITCIIIRAVDS